jgi:hypothetical protein
VPFTALSPMHIPEIQLIFSENTNADLAKKMNLSESKINEEEQES